MKRQPNFMPREIRGLVLISLVVQTGLMVAAQDFDKAVAPFFEEHCNRCHNAERQKGDFRLDTLSRDFHSGEDTPYWVEVMDRINSGEMPPEDEPLPSIGEIEHVVSWLGERIKEGELARLARRPEVAHYRLSREEYANTVYDLLGVFYDPNAPGEMSEDPVWHGFQRIGSQLTLAPSHVEKYMKAAREVIDIAYPDKPVKPRLYRKDALDIDWSNREKRSLLEERGMLEEVRTLIWPGHALSYAGPAHINYEQPPGLYRVRMKLSGLQPVGGPPPHVTLYSKRLDRILFEQDVLAPEEEPVILEFETYLKGKINITINNEVPGPSNSGRAGRPTSQYIFTTLDNPYSRAPWQRKMTDDQGHPLYPFLIFDWIEWEGPVVRPEDEDKRARFFPSDGATADDAGERLHHFARAAWRRPLERGELNPYLDIIGSEMEEGSTLREAYKTVMLAVLTSKNFYYLAEGSPGEKRDRINDVELASRLSYFLWSSLPDEPLLSLAGQGRLGDPVNRERQVERMLGDSRIERFTTSFPRQWLQLEKVGMFPPDSKLYPDYDPWLEKSMVKETTSFFAEVFRKNLSIREFLDSDWTMVNPRLARHYGLEPPSLSGMQRVVLDKNDRRGGILTHASVLSLSSDGTRHRPVHRGVWLSESILGKIPNPPPPNVDPIEPNPVDEPKATIRMKLEAHRADASCASCHQKIDPLGLAFDNYDAIGRWRTEEYVARGKGANPPVDASGELPDGRKFDGPDEFRQLLVDDIDQFAVAVTEKLATYALRRVMTIDDRDEIRAIAKRARENDYRLRAMVKELVRSELFMGR